MTKVELLKLLEQVPDDAEIVVRGNDDDILGDYSYSPYVQVTKDIAYGKRLDLAISNYCDGKDPKEVWVIQ